MFTSSRYLQRRSETGFTLVELMVVVLIIGILAAIAIPVFLHLQLEAAKSSVKSDVRNSVTSIAEYLTQNPNAEDLRAGVTLTTGGTKDTHGVAAHGLDIVVSEGNRLEVYGGWQNWRVYGENAGVDGWVYAYYSNPTDPEVVAYTPDGEQWVEFTTLPEVGTVDPGATGPQGLCATWPELGALSTNMAALWGSPLVVELTHVMETEDWATYDQWYMEQTDPLLVNQLPLESVMMSSTGPDGQDGYNTYITFVRAVLDPVDAYLYSKHAAPLEEWTAEELSHLAELARTSVDNACTSLG